MNIQCMTRAERHKLMPMCGVEWNVWSGVECVELAYSLAACSHGSIAS